VKFDSVAFRAFRRGLCGRYPAPVHCGKRRKASKRVPKTQKETASARRVTAITMSRVHHDALRANGPRSSTTCVRSWFTPVKPDLEVSIEWRHPQGAMRLRAKWRQNGRNGAKIEDWPQSMPVQSKPRPRKIHCRLSRKRIPSLLA
jgi:hypothetical protein